MSVKNALYERVLAAVRDEHLVGRDGVAGVALRLLGDRGPQFGEPGRGRVVVVLDLGGGDARCLHDVGGGREVGLAGPEADHVLAGRLQRLGLGIDRQRDGFGYLRDLA